MVGVDEQLGPDAGAGGGDGVEVRSGGSTSIDVTERGVDKAFGMRELSRSTGIALDEMLFIGDRLDPDGNDYPVLELGVTCHAVTGWRDTAAYLAELLSGDRETERA